MILEVFVLGYFHANCYLIADEKSRECAVIDPGGTPDKVINRCSELGLEIKYILLTHGHGDHLAGVAKIKSETGAKVLMNKKDEYLVHGGNAEIIPIFRNIKPFEVDDFVKEGDFINIGDIKIEVIETPGHTPGGLTFKIDNMIFTGDTLFNGSIGRTDFPKGNFDELIYSIKTKILILDDDIKVLPGHGEASTVGNERKYNPFLN